MDDWDPFEENFSIDEKLGTNDPVAVYLQERKERRLREKERLDKLGRDVRFVVSDVNIVNNQLQVKDQNEERRRGQGQNETEKLQQIQFRHEATAPEGKMLGQKQKQEQEQKQEQMKIQIHEQANEQEIEQSQKQGLEYNDNEGQTQISDIESVPTAMPMITEKVQRVLTPYGVGLLLEVRASDGMHLVQPLEWTLAGGKAPVFYLNQASITLDLAGEEVKALVLICDGDAISFAPCLP